MTSQSLDLLLGTMKHGRLVSHDMRHMLFARASSTGLPEKERYLPTGERPDPFSHPDGAEQQKEEESFEDVMTLLLGG